MLVVVEQQNIEYKYTAGCRIHIAHSLKTSESHFISCEGQQRGNSNQWRGYDAKDYEKNNPTAAMHGFAGGRIHTFKKFGKSYEGLGKEITDFQTK